MRFPRPITTFLLLAFGLATPQSQASVVDLLNKRYQSEPAPAQDSFFGESVGSTGYVFVNGHGLHGSKMLFCEPQAGHVEWLPDYPPHQNQIGGGECLSNRDGKTVVFRALTTQAYLDELFGSGKVEAVSVAPAFTSKHGLMAVIYFREMPSVQGQ